MKLSFFLTFITACAMCHAQDNPLPTEDPHAQLQLQQDVEVLAENLNRVSQTLQQEEQRHSAIEDELKNSIKSMKMQLKRLRGGNVDDQEMVVDDGSIAAGKPRNWNMIDALTKSFLMIMVSEMGDETFIIAALMAMRHPRGIVLAGALSALYFMTVLSTALGFVVPNLISRKATHNAATALYIFFGARLFYIAYTADASEQDEEMEEVEHKLKSAPSKNSVRQFFSRICTPIFLEAFVLTFLAEWGDRSQIATITLAATDNPVGVTIGACVGHTICTSIAVVGGRIAAMKISQKTVALCGGLTFVVFAIHNVFFSTDI